MGPTQLSSLLDWFLSKAADGEDMGYSEINPNPIVPIMMRMGIVLIAIPWGGDAQINRLENIPVLNLPNFLLHLN